ncbi:MAG: aminotransferase class I/II-fold pyridoxal phosphate-dependent enzyme [Paracoccaceae bacterium]
MTVASSRLDPVKPSASAWVSQAAKEAKARGEDVTDLGFGKPDFDTPAHIIEVAHAAALRGETRYPPTNGTSEMRQAVVDKLARENDLSYGVDDVTAYILKDAGIAAVPGSTYELSPFLRISTAASMDVLGHAMDRLAAFVAKLERKI